MRTPVSLKGYWYGLNFTRQFVTDIDTKIEPASSPNRVTMLSQLSY